MNKKLIAVDLDGTLLNSESKLSPYTIETIQKISKQGHRVIITTGRPYRMADHIYRELGLESPMINFNGALTHIPNKKWSKELSMTLDKKYLLDMVERENDIQADFIAGEYRNKFYVTPTTILLIPPYLGFLKSPPKQNLKLVKLPKIQMLSSFKHALKISML